mmetsp:Transcript_2784/g.8288  ORF Transcript_2784/g.8288 Transcript_2784/m.8288 type:complete len:118 (+) Transcript_2784:119-472(+)
MIPSPHTRITSQATTVESRCAIATDVLPLRAASSACWTMPSLAVSKALVASSSSSTRGFRTNARQMATRCFWPPERRPPRGPTTVSQPPCAASTKSICAMALQSDSCCSDTSSAPRP